MPLANDLNGLRMIAEPESPAAGQTGRPDAPDYRTIRLDQTAPSAPDDVTPARSLPRTG